MKITHFLVAVLFTALSSKAFAIVDIQGQIGKRWADVDQDGSKYTLNGIETVVSAHINPIPLPIVSIGFGASLGVTQWDTDDFKSQGDFESVEKLSNVDFALEVMASASVHFLIEPYAKLGYVVTTAYVVESTYLDGDGVKQSFVVGQKGSGLNISLGMKKSLLPLVSLLLEYKMSDFTYEFDEVKIAGESQKPDYKTKFKSNSLLVGVEVGF